MNKVILCVDDEPLILTAIKFLLQQCFGREIVVETAQSGHEALEIIHELIATNEGQLAVIISDQIMPGMKGDEFLTAAQKISPRSLKILLTGQASKEAIIKSLNKANLYRFIDKPWDALDMELTIREAINVFDKENTILDRNKELKTLNEGLEKKVEERTRELYKKNKELEDSIAQVVSAQRQLLESEKMAALGQLIAGVAHEVNTPLSIVNACIGQNITIAQTSLQNLNTVIELLKPHPEEFELFKSMISEFNYDFLTSKEERERKKNVRVFFTTHNLPLDSLTAQHLVDIGQVDALETFLPLLRHPKASLIIQVAHDMLMVNKNNSHIREAIKKATKIIYALKSYSRISHYESPVKIDLIDNIETVLILYGHQLKQGVDVIRKFPSEEVTLAGYPDELNQVWTNLIQNSIQAMGNSGTLTIEIIQHSSTVDVSISDSGHGIPDELRERIFEPFFTTKRIGEGTGLGLDIVKKIIDKHHGTIGVTSEVGRGTTFTISLPQ